MSSWHRRPRATSQQCFIRSKQPVYILAQGLLPSPVFNASRLLKARDSARIRLRMVIDHAADYLRVCVTEFEGVCHRVVCHRVVCHRVVCHRVASPSCVTELRGNVFDAAGGKAAIIGQQKTYVVDIQFVPESSTLWLWSFGILVMPGNGAVLREPRSAAREPRQRIRRPISTTNPSANPCAAQQAENGSGTT